MTEIIQFQKFVEDGANMTFEVEFLDVDESEKRRTIGVADVTLPLDADSTAIETAILAARTPGMLARARVEGVLEKLNAPKPDEAGKP